MLIATSDKYFNNVQLNVRFKSLRITDLKDKNMTVQGQKNTVNGNNLLS